jgi:hypothetical protein
MKRGYSALVAVVVTLLLTSCAYHPYGRYNTPITAGGDGRPAFPFTMGDLTTEGITGIAPIPTITGGIVGKK